MHILVTGGNGFIGSQVVKQLVANGHNVRCSFRETSDRRRLKGLPYEVVIADVRNRLSILEAVNGCDAIIHCASLSNWKDLNSPTLSSIIIEGTRNLIDAAMAQGARMVYVSSAAALGASRDPLQLRTANSEFNLSRRAYKYAALKAEADRMCMEAVKMHGADIITAHPTETYGPGDDQHVTASTLIEFARGKACLTTKGGTSVVHVEDVAAGIVAACEKGKTGAKYVLGGENCTISRIAEITRSVCGLPFHEIRIPQWLLLLIAFGFQLSPFTKAKTLAIKYRYAAHYWYFDNTPTIEALGVKFRSPEETLRATINWLKTQPNGI